MIHNTLTIAGMDPSGGAGILADVKAMSALGSYACAVVAALTAQNTHGVTGVQAITPEFVALQLDTLFQDVRIDAVKIGMLGHEKVTLAVAEKLAQFKPEYIVLDPVMVAKSGDILLEKNAIHALKEALIPLSSIITPNLPEAGVLLDARPAETLKEMYRIAEKLRKLMSDRDNKWVLLKGGHLPGNDTIDLLYNGDKMIELPGQRIATKNTHGTGCTLSAAICALLPQHKNIPEATKQAKKYLLAAIAKADLLTVGSGHGPVQHFHAWW
ncbi:MAG: bifunctional hydroxymethylpyrimidine kinase/phosphomethylpyrimidine kinase [Advenella sp.]|nr:bifunctional hydroxymethylpyrimidine kinase/phosphomethylpyrimidine kinase [Advenella sp.]